MKAIMTFGVLLLLTQVLTAQALIKNVSVEKVNDSLYTIITTYNEPTGRELVDKSSPADSSKISQEVLESIKGIERYKVLYLNALYEYNNLAKSYQISDTICSKIFRQSRLDFATKSFTPIFTGVYQLNKGGQLAQLVRINELGDIHIIDQQTGLDVNKVGNITPLTDGTLFNSTGDVKGTFFSNKESPRLFKSLDTNTVFVFLGKTIEDARSFIQSVNN